MMAFSSCQLVGKRKRKGLSRAKMVFSSFRLRKVRPMENKEPSKCQITAHNNKGIKASVSLTMESEPMAGHLNIEVGKQPGAVLLEKVAFKATAEGTARIRSVNEGYQTITFILCTIFLFFAISVNTSLMACYHDGVVTMLHLWEKLPSCLLL